MNCAKKMFFIIASVVIFSSNVYADMLFVDLGGGVPFGLISYLNNTFSEALKQAKAAFGNSTGEKLHRAGGGTFLINTGFSFKDKDTTGNPVFGVLVGYLYSGTGWAKYTNNFTNSGTDYSVSVSGYYAINSLRVLPILYKPGKGQIGYGIGAGLDYSFIKYSQKQNNNIPNSMQLPKMDSKSSGVTWIIWGCATYKSVGMDISFTRFNTCCVGVFFHI